MCVLRPAFVNPSHAHTHTHAQSCSVPPIEAELSVQIKEVRSLQWYCQMQDSTAPRIPSLACDALYGLLHSAQVEMQDVKESHVRIYAYIYVSDFFF